MADYFLSDLVETTALVNTDLLHIRTIGNVDKKVQFFNLVKTFRDILNKNTNYTIVDADRNPIILVDSSSGNVTITLPNLVANQNKMIWVVKLVAANNVIVDGEGEETINGAANYTLVKQYEYIKVSGRSSSWFIDGKGPIRAADIDFGVAVGDVDGDVLPLGTAVTSSPTGGTATNLANSSFVRAAIQEVLNRLIDLSGVGNIAVKARHIDFSVAAGDVDADILPLGTIVSSSPTGGTATNLAAASFVRAALQEIFNRLITLTGVSNLAVLTRHIANNNVTMGKVAKGTLDTYIKGQGGSNSIYEKLALRDTGIKIGTDTRNAVGNQTISGVGFQPTVVLLFAFRSDETDPFGSWGFDDGTVHMCLTQQTTSANLSYLSDKSIAVIESGALRMDAYISALNSDGFVLTWAIAGTLTTRFIYLCLP